MVDKYNIYVFAENSPVRQYAKGLRPDFQHSVFSIALQVHEVLEEKYYSHCTIDGLQAFYYAMEELAKYEASRPPMEVFSIAQTEMQWAWSTYYDKMEEERMAEESIANNYEVWIEDDLPW